MALGLSVEVVRILRRAAQLHLILLTIAHRAMPPSKSPRQVSSKLRTASGSSIKLGESSKAPAQSRKRAAQASVEEDSEDELGLNGNALESEEEEVSVDGMEDEESGDEEESFPELDSGSEDELEEGSAKGLALDDADLDQDTDDSEYGGLGDEESGDEEGYNSSDIEALYSSSTSVSSHASSSKYQLNTRDKGQATAAKDEELAKRTDLTTDQKLERMIADGIVKPDETLGSDAKISHAKEGKGVLRPSKLVPGGYRREYDDVEAGYGSESSTEDVRALTEPCWSCPDVRLESQHRWQHPHGVVRRPSSYRV